MTAFRIEVDTYLLNHYLADGEKSPDEGLTQTRLKRFTIAVQPRAVEVLLADEEALQVARYGVQKAKSEAVQEELLNAALAFVDDFIDEVIADAGVADGTKQAVVRMPVTQARRKLANPKLVPNKMKHSGYAILS